MSEQPTVTVVIVNYNAGENLAEALRKLDGQTFRDFELLLVDNASTDNSLAAWPAERPGLIRLDRNIGFAAANNLAAEQAKGRYLALLNPDAFPAPDWLDALVAAAEAHPDVAGFGSRMLMAREPGRLDGTGDVYTAAGAAFRRDHGCPERPRPDGEVFGVSAAAALYRREPFLAAGGFDEELFCYLEDVDLAFRLRLAGHRFRHVDSAIVRHVGAASSGGGESAFAVYYGQRNLVRVFLADMPGPLLWRYLPAHIALNLALVARGALRGQIRVTLRAKWDAIRGIPRALARRRAVQAERRAAARDIAAALDRRPFALFRHALARTARRRASRSPRSGAETTG